MASTDDNNNDEFVYHEYLRKLPLKSALANYCRALFFEPLNLLHVGLILLLKTPMMLAVPGKVAFSWQLYCMGIKALPTSYAVARKELLLKLFHRY
ncbi:hypothetical protein [Planctobacterium marinum]|uniref:hypothetical protein n=1 Tax=Planctobacterium marinum TaxID=1631968 RepID=UPI001E3D08E0|nr:hypothetical protein [Planctobacterium marinum]MCC2604433.1 hypothetical protein [Planctobacterium marinum]